MDHTYNPTTNLWTRPDFTGIGYSDGQSFEFGLLETIRNSSDRSVFSAELQSKIGDWRSEYHLTPARHCLLRPLQFAPGESLLELGCGCGAITRYLGERGLNVTAVEGGAPRAAITAERCRDLPNVRVMLDDLVQFESDQQFDWVTLIGVLEYSPYFAPGPDPVLAYLQQALRYLKPGGRLVIAIENQLGLKYFNGCGEDHQGTPFFGPNGLYGENTAVTFGKERLEEILRRAGCSSVEFLYPFPDYKIPGAVVSDRAFHTPGFSVADLLLRTEARDYAGRNRRLFSEQLVARTLEDNHVLQHFANSFLIVAARDATNPSIRADELAWCFAPGRLPAFRTETTFVQDAAGAIQVVKTHLGPMAAEATANDAGIGHQLGTAPYSRGRLMAWPMLKAKLQANAEQELINAYLPYAHHLLSNSCPLAGQDPLQLANWETAGRHIDLTPFNLVENGDQITAIDEEWSLAQAIPAGWVLLRAIIQTSALSVGRRELARTTLASLLTGIATQLGLQIEGKHIDAWLAREAEFLRQATGRTLRQPTAQTSLLELSANRLVDLDNLQEDSSAKAGGKAEAGDQASFDALYRQWLARRSFVNADAELIERSIRSWQRRPVFQIVLRVADGQQSLLADTFESLNHQFYGNWRVDVVSTLPAPAGIEEVPNIGWQSIGDRAHGKATLDLLQAAHSCDWIIEVPPGTVLDPLCLWRIGHEADRNPDAIAFYTDDDVVAAAGRCAPRFKSALNVEWLRCADIVGPLFVSRKALRRAGGLAETEEGSWYDLLLRLLESAERQQIRHIADVLLSYRDAIPAAPDACMHALARHLTRRGEAADVSPSSPHTWSVVYHPAERPKVSIIIPSSHSLEFLQPCLDSLLGKTTDAAYEILVVSTTADADTDCQHWLAERAAGDARLRLIAASEARTPAQAFNLGASEATGEMLVLLREDTRVLQDHWLTEMLKIGRRPGIGAVTPRLVQPHSGLVENVGYVFGLGGLAGSPHHGSEKFSADGFMNLIQVSREVSAAPLTCLLVSRQLYTDVGGLDASALPFHHADIDFSLKLRQSGHSLVYCPAVTVVHYGNIAGAEFPPDPLSNVRKAQQEASALATVQQRWRTAMLGDGLWNRNLSLDSVTPTLDAQILPTWRYLPSDVPRILARSLPNGQGQYRVTLPLRAARAAARAQSCEILQDQNRAFNPLEIARLGADSFIVQHFLTDARLGELHQYRKFAPDAFIVYACDDLLTDMPLKSHFRRLVPADSRTRFKSALKACDRLVVSTPFLAEAFRHFIDDIRVVPNRIERATWLSLNSKRRAGPRPRVGWAGGTGHQGDLELLKPVIEATRSEADWIFFGMCPEEIRPLLAEYHELADFQAYPRKLAALNLDLAVAPLEDIPFNHGKSNLRLIEYGALGLPVLCSDVTPYRDSPALRLPNDPQRWIAALRERLHDLDAAEREGQAMRQWVLDNYVLEEHVDEWLEAHLSKS